ncbi:hypothetical protein GCM10007094_13870 [Pseudovibrio japonicus]|uniref:Uncharacterized protein n=1 Tax=Pseudovibrio japonicus TaxID=366534 RepID=A0ABQ3E9A5_9HYPH|nr:hypothetical protein GCM10007094_13870 [Pseudovibrio japonicus]
MGQTWLFSLFQECFWEACERICSALVFELGREARGAGACLRLTKELFLRESCGFWPKN